MTWDYYLLKEVDKSVKVARSLGQAMEQKVERERIKKERTALANQVRGLLAEYGVVIPKEVTTVRKALPEIPDPVSHVRLSLAITARLTKKY
ncbi:MAG: hypothetical protein ABFS39_10820 [Pseudomonadota bacterium]